MMLSSLTSSAGGLSTSTESVAGSNGSNGYNDASPSLVPALPKSSLNEFGMALYENLKSDIDSLQQAIVSEDEGREQLFKKVRASFFCFLSFPKDGFEYVVDA